MLTAEQRSAWERDGFFIVPGFGSQAAGDAMHARAVELARESGGKGMAGASIVQPEAQRPPGARTVEDGVSKVFNLHRNEPEFRHFIGEDDVLGIGSALLGPDLDCFLSQFIFKNPGALGQPWHQDSYYFPFDRTPQVGLWLAITAATTENGCLEVLAGSHREPVHEHVPDRRPAANYGYVEIVDHDMSGAVSVEMEPGDLLVFHSHLMHRSTDNESAELRAAMVYHLAQAGTVDRAAQPAPINDWMAVRRRVDTQIDIAAPLSRVWQALTDGAGYADWNPYLVKIDGEIRAGSDIVAHSHGENGATMAMPAHVVSVEAPCMRWQGSLPDSALFKGDHFFVLEALEQSVTRLRHYEDFTGTLLEEIVVPRADVIRANFERMNFALRSHCEA